MGFMRFNKEQEACCLVSVLQMVPSLENRYKHLRQLETLSTLALGADYIGITKYYPLTPLLSRKPL